MSTTAHILAGIADHLEESMGVRSIDSRPSLAPTPQTRDNGRRPLRGYGAVPVDQVMPDPEQPRVEFSEKELNGLAHSIREKGQLSPIRVRWSQTHAKWMIIFGERRWRAACRAGLAEIDCHFHETDLTAGQILEQQLVENCLRENLQPIEEARAFARLMEMKRWTGKQLAQALRVSESRVSRALALLRLPGAVQEKVNRGDVSSRAAYELARLQNNAVQGRLADQAAGMTVAATARAVRKSRGGQAPARRGTKQTFFAEGWKITVTSQKRGTYHEIEEALTVALDEVRHRINYNRQLS